MNPQSTPVASIEKSTSSSPPPMNLPLGDLLGNIDDYNNICVPLYTASMKGDWEAARDILEEHQDLDLLGFAITENYDTALHIAASAKSSKSMEYFVKNLVRKMTERQLELQNNNYNTALCLAVGNINIATSMIAKNRNLLNIPASKGLLPLCMASLSGQSEIVNFFYDNSNKMTGGLWTDQNRKWVFEKCVELDLFDISLTIVADWPELTVNGRVLRFLAEKTYAFRSVKSNFWRAMSQVTFMEVGPAGKPSTDAMQLLRIIWTKIMKLSKDQIHDIIGDVLIDEEENGRISSSVLFIAAKEGNTEFVVELLRQYPDLLWKRNHDNHTIFHVAVSHRHEGIYSLLHEMGSMKELMTSVVDRNGDNMLHLVARMENQHDTQDKSAVRLQVQQMQREVLWFKDVSNMIPPSYRQMKNKYGETPHKLFKSEHGYLLAYNEKWIKATANQCLVVGALIASVGFALAFAVPGGYNPDTGIPPFLDKRAFILFTISDAISLAFSTISILVFLSIFISSHVEDDFLQSVPTQFMVGLGTLFLSIASMLVAFCTGFFIYFQDSLSWVPVIIGALVSYPVIIYASLQYNLLNEAFRSTYRYRDLFRPKKLRLYHQNPRW